MEHRFYDVLRITVFSTVMTDFMVSMKLMILWENKYLQKWEQNTKISGRIKVKWWREGGRD